MNPFDFVNAINLSKKDLIRSGEASERSYTPFFVNKALSYFPETIMYANEVNRISHADNIMQNDYFLNTIRPGKRYSKWHKKEVSEQLDVIQEYYQVSYSKALEIRSVLTQDQLDLIRTKIIKGGNDVQHRSNGGGEAKQS